MAITGTQGPSGIGNIDLRSVDLETALMAVQSERANLLETQLKDQLVAVQNRNQQIQVLNDALANVRASRPSSSDPKAAVGIGGTVTIPDGLTTPGQPNTVDTVTALQSMGVTPKSGKLTQSDYDQLISTITSHIDGLNSSQQMDMLRMQSLSNKRNEAFDTMTGFLKKSDDSRKNIVDHM